MTFLPAEALFFSTLVMLAVLAVRRPVARWLGAGAAYALWLLVPLRLFLPQMDLFDAGFGVSLPPLDLGIESGGMAAPSSPQGGPGQWVPDLLAIWAVGAVIFLAWQWLNYRHFLQRLSLSSQSVGSHEDIPLIRCGAVEGPVAVGLLDRRILVPEDFEVRYSAEERRLALDHEALHHRRGDIWWNFLGLAVLAIHWFNPVAWLSFRAFREDQELACDAAILSAAGPEQNLFYARAMIKSASHPGMVAACPLNRASQLKRRLKMMNRHHYSMFARLGGAIAFVAGATLVTASAGTAHPHPEPEKSESRTRIVIMDRTGEGGDVQRFQVRRGEDGRVIAPEGCREGEALADMDEREGDRRMRVLLCNRGGEGVNGAGRLEGLQRARDRLAGMTELGDAERSRVIAALDREIARLRAQ